MTTLLQLSHVIVCAKRAIDEPAKFGVVQSYLLGQCNETIGDFAITMAYFCVYRRDLLAVVNEEVVVVVMVSLLLPKTFAR
jgi:hypothetical protein